MAAIPAGLHRDCDEGVGPTAHRRPPDSLHALEGDVTGAGLAKILFKCTQDT